MDKRYTLILMGFFCAAFGYNKVLAQNKIADSIQLHQTTVSMAAMFNKAVVEQSRIYNGPAFVPYQFVSTTNANFRDTTGFYYGTVNYDDVTYNNVPLIYNIERDVLISRLFNGVALYTLVNEKVSDFNIMGHHFVRLQADALNPQFTTGYYDELYHNKIQVYARHTKEIEVSRVMASFFIEKTDYFLKKDGKYYNVNSEGKFYDALKDKKKELKQYLKDKKIRFKDNPEQTMAELAAYYEHLTN